MKKIVFMLAVAAIAVSANAAFVDWQFGKDTSYNNYTVYAFDAANQATVLAALAAYDSDAQTTIDGLVLSSETVKKGNAKATGVDVGSATSLMLLAVNGAFEDGKAFQYDTLSLAGYTYEGTDASPGYDALSSLGNSGTVVAKSSGGGDEPVTPTIPEPTSGLLMLVGLGALALRRRR